MSGTVGAGCRIMRCPYFDGSACLYDGDRCRHNLEKSFKLHDAVNAGMDAMHNQYPIKLKIALDALAEISDLCVYSEIYDTYTGAEEMRNIADSALRRLSLNRPDA